MSLRTKAIQGVFWSGVRSSGSTLISTLTFLVLARLLAPGEFGLIAYAVVFTSFLSIIQRAGFGQAIVQRREIEPEHLNAAFWINTTGGVLLAGATVLAADLVAATVDQPGLAPVLRVLGGVVLIDALGNTPRAILRRNLEFRSLAARAVVSAAIGAVVGVTMATAGFGVWSLVGQQVTASIAGTIAVWIASRWRPGLRFAVRHAQDLMGFGVFAMGMDVLNHLTRRMPDLLIGLYLGLETLGYYTLGARLVVMITRLFTGTVQSVALPTFSRIQHDHGQMRQAFLTATGMSALIALPAFLGLAVLAPDLIPALFGTQWAASVPILSVVAFAGIVQSVTFFTNPVILACGKPSWAFTLAVVRAGTSVLAFFLAVRGGIVWVAVAFTIHAWVFAPLPLALVRRLIALPIGRYLGQMAAPTGAAVVMVVAIVLVQPFLRSLLHPYAVLTVDVAGGALAYAVVLHLVAPHRLRQVIEYARIALPSGRGSAPASGAADVEED